MNKGTKTIGVIFSLLLLSILLFVVLISAVYPLPLMLERFRFFTITNYYMQQYIFWVAVGLAILLIIALLIVIFYPKTIKGELKRTSSLIGKTRILMDEIEKEVKQLLGTDEQVKVSVKYTGYQAPTNKYQTNEHARVE